MKNCRHDSARVEYVFAVLLLCFATSVHADVIVLKTGKDLKGDVTHYRDGKITIKMSNGKSVTGQIQDVKEIRFLQGAGDAPSPEKRIALKVTSDEEKRAAYQAGVRKKKYEKKRLSKEEVRAYEFEAGIDKSYESLKRCCFELGLNVTISGGSQLAKPPTKRREKYRAGRMTDEEMTAYERELIALWRYLVAPYAKTYLRIRGMSGTVGISVRGHYNSEIVPALMKEHEKEIAFEISGIEEAVAKMRGMPRPTGANQVFDSSQVGVGDGVELVGDPATITSTTRAYAKSEKQLRRLREIQTEGNQALAEDIARNEGISVGEARETERYRNESGRDTFVLGE